MFLKICLVFTFLSVLNAAEIPVGNTTVNIQEIFQKNCQNELKAYIDNVQKDFNGTQSTEQTFNVSSVECLMFCGYKRVGILDNDGNVVMDYLKILDPKADSTFQPMISKCASTEKTANVCKKALKNVKCVFSEVSWTAIGIINFKLLQAYTGV